MGWSSVKKLSALIEKPIMKNAVKIAALAALLTTTTVSADWDMWLLLS